MGRSLSLAAYRALSRRRSRPVSDISGARPDGEVLWLHATNDRRHAALVEFGTRMRLLRPELQLLMTREKEQTAADSVAGEAGYFGVTFETDHPTLARQFLDHWRPDLCLWAGGVLMPNLISLASEQGIPMFLIDVTVEDFPSRRHKWFPDLTRASLNSFEQIMTTSQAAVGMLRRIGLSARKVSVAENLRGNASPAPFSEDDLGAVSGDLGGRPVWLAAHAQPQETDTILNAHRGAIRLVHRLLLVLIVANPDDLDDLEETMRGSGLRFARWELGDPIDDNTQVLISDGVEDLGLWYRAAPLTLLASSLYPDMRGRNPLEAAALGSAILFGPHVRDHLDTYSRLSAAGAARTIDDLEGLSAAVIRLIAPDHAAAMAMAGWEVATEGAELTDKLAELVQDRLDLRMVSNART